MAILKGGIILVKEAAIGTIDGANKIFTTSKVFVPNTLRVRLNGLVLFNTDDFTELTNQSFEFVQAPTGGSDPDRVLVEYQRA